MLRVEKTFLVDRLPADLHQTHFSRIRQCYLINSPDACRIREKDGEYTIAHKMFTRMNDYSHREFEDFPIAQQEFEILWQTAKSRLEKNRYYYKATIGYILRIDEFLGPLTGLYLAEMIMLTEDTQNGIEELSWLGPEITHEVWAYNQYLSTQTFNSIKNLIEPFGIHLNQENTGSTQPS